MAKKKMEQSVGPVMTPKEAAGICPGLDIGLWFCRMVVTGIVAVAMSMVLAVAVVPAVGQTFLTYSGLGPQSTMAEVIAIWMIPQLFITGLIAAATVAFCKWVWRTLKDKCQHKLVSAASAKVAKQAAAEIVEPEREAEPEAEPEPEPEAEPADEPEVEAVAIPEVEAVVAEPEQEKKPSFMEERKRRKLERRKRACKNAADAG